MRVSLQASVPTVDQVLALTLPAPAVFARLAATACPSLVVGSAPSPPSGPPVVYPPSSDAGGCLLGATASPLSPRFMTDTLAVTGRVAMVPPVSGFGPDAVILTEEIGLVGQSTIYGFPSAGAPVAWYIANEGLSLASSADLDGDGTVEGIVASAFDIEVLRRIPNAQPVETQFDPYRIPTTGTPTHIVVSDLDVDGFSDIAFTVSNGLLDVLEIAWGAPGLPLAPVEASQSADVDALVAVNVPDSNDQNARIPDLAMIAGLHTGNPTLTVLHGGAQRTLPAYFDPRPVHLESTFVALATGRFAGQSDPTIQDVFAVEEPNVVSSGTPIQRDPYVWLIPGGSTASLGASSSQQAPSSQPACELACTGGTSLCSGQVPVLCGADAQFTPWSIGPRDVAIGIDIAGEVATVDPMSGVVTACTNRPCGPQGQLVLRHLFAAGNADTRELFAAFADGFAPTGELDGCTVDNGVVQGCTALTGSIAGIDGTWQCNDAQHGALIARGPFDPLPPDSVDDFLVLCHRGDDDQVFRVEWTTSGYSATSVVDQAGAQFMVLADVTGDAVPDILLLDFSNTAHLPTMHVYPQCESRDAACRKMWLQP
jgi:hypothetical protein